jgi:hypothetical protein
MWPTDGLSYNCIAMHAIRTFAERIKNGVRCTCNIIIIICIAIANDSSPSEHACMHAVRKDARGLRAAGDM